MYLKDYYLFYFPLVKIKTIIEDQGKKYIYNQPTKKFL